MNDDNVSEETLKRYLKGNCTKQELEQIELFLAEQPNRDMLQQLMEKETHQLWNEPTVEEPVHQQKVIDWRHRVQQRMDASLTDNVSKQTAGALSRLRSLTLRYAAVFVGFMFLATTSWLLLNKNAPQTSETAQQEVVQPGGNKALLTLADGSVIALGEASNGTIAIQHGVNIEKDADGNIRYAVDDKSQTTSLAMNTISTPRGGQYRITLPDGSIAMLNAGSSLSYPVRFTDGERRVKMTGEVYFEIVKATDKRKKRIPFFVETDGQEIQVLGTIFNVNAYRDENAVRTTLAEGSVKVKTANGQTALLKSGQQAILAADIQVSPADLKSQLAWVDGDFVFQGSKLGDVLRQLSRWYDIEVDCPPQLATLQLDAMISRDRPLATVIAIIKSTYPDKLQLKMTGRRLTVTD